MYRFIAAMLAAAFCAGVAQAQSGEVLTLEQALAQAGAASPAVEMGEAGVRAADAGRIVAGLRPNPSVQIQAENVIGTGSYHGLSSAETTASLQLPLELGGKRSARIAVADSRRTRAQVAAVMMLGDLRLRVTQVYIAAVAAERRLGVAQTQAEIADEGLRVARDRVQVGATSPIDEQRADVLRINAATALDRARRAVTVARDALARLTGQPVTGALDLGWFDRVGGYGPAIPVRAERTLAWAAAKADLATADAQVRLARSQRVPDITLSAGARRLAATNDMAAVFGVSIPIPLFNNGRAALDQARAERDHADAQRRLTLTDAEQAIASAEAERDNEAATARAAGGAGLAAAVEAARIARIGYGQGKFGQLELLEAERTLAETRGASIDALAAYHDAEARLKRLTAPAPLYSGDTQ
ncbi:TolC family protein [Sphingomonas alpina]|uniref:TolC family protein n=1 Tax=Sphingomonas alpina TaxID=653931 RepID=A0A7H0LFF4_9SPHN|nr:TolC family protein [Sphingomonas alpina]QNQ08407.1 TolC family protein [Sphingomonas alpina]